MKRRLSSVEQVLWFLSDEDELNFAIAARVDGPIPDERIAQAVAQVRARHPLLGVRLALDDKGKPWFESDGVGTTAIRFVERCSDDTWIEELTTALQQPFILERGPLVRYVVCSSPEVSELIVVCHHTIADGLSGAFIIRDLLTLLGDPDASLPPLSELPGPDELIPMSVRKDRRMQILVGSVSRLVRAGVAFAKLRASLGKRSSNGASDGLQVAQSGSDPLATPQHDLGIMSWELTEIQTTALLTSCKREQVSVHAALCTAFLVAQRDVML